MIDLEPLRRHGQRLTGSPLPDLVRADPSRAAGWALRCGPLYFNFARQRLDGDALAALVQAGESCDLAGALRRMVDGEHVNGSEDRPALHTALRSDLGASPAARAARDEAQSALERALALAEDLRGSGITDVVNVGIGGSDLGPRLVVDALAEPDARPRVHFLANVDGHAARRLLARLDPGRSAAVLVSKSFGTQETLLNGAIVRAWLGDDSRLYAASARPDRAREWGIDPARVLPMWDWVGGRYSLWSAAGFAIMVALGAERFRRLLAGAASIDAHALSEPVASNIPLLHALLAVWNRNVLGHASHAVLPYDERLALLPAHLQQLVMESLGKSVDVQGRAMPVATVPVIWGGAGTTSQHSFFQALHQGTDIVPCDFIGVAGADHAFVDNHDALLAHLLAQPQAMANGQSSEDPQRAYPGGRPSTFMLLDRLDPAALGALVALYEHSTVAQAALWGINPFDQWGVELGKAIAGTLLPAVQGGAVGPQVDPVTRALLTEIARRRGG